MSWRPSTRPRGPRLESVGSICVVVALLAIAGWSMFLRPDHHTAAHPAELQQLTECDKRALAAMQHPKGHQLTKKDVAVAKHQCGWGG